MTYVKCANCGEVVEIPDELRGDCPDGDITAALGEPYYCDACDSTYTQEFDTFSDADPGL